MKPPDPDEDDEKGSDSRWSEAALEFAYNRQELQKFIDRDPVLQILRPKQISVPKGPIAAPTASDNKLDLVKGLMNLLKKTGLVASPFDANELFDLDLKVIQSSIKTFFDKLKAQVGEIPTDQNPAVPDPRSSPQIGSTGYRTASPYLSAAEPGSDSSSEPRRMSLGPSGAAMLEARSKEARHERPRPRSRKPKSTSTDRAASATRTEESTEKLESYFQAAMNRFLKEQQEASTRKTAMVAVTNVGSQDVEMESTGSHDPESSHWEYDPDDVDPPPTSARAAVATAAAGPTNSSMIQRVRISAISDLKEFTGRDQDEDRARSWISKVKSAFLRDQATDEEKCLTFADLLSGPAKNWYRQLARSTRNKWSELLRNFQVQYYGLGVSVAWQYYHSRKRSEESPLDYLYRLNVAALRAKLKIKDGDSKTRREHVEHFIETHGDPDLADRLTLLRLGDADDLEEVLRARDRAKGRQKRSAFGSKYRQKASTPAPAAPTKRSIHTVQRSVQESGSDTGSDGSDSEGDLRRIYLTSAEEKTYEAKDDASPTEQTQHGRIGPDPPRSRLRRHTASARGKDVKLGRSPGWNPVRVERSRYCIYAFVNKNTVDRLSGQPDLRGNTCDLHAKPAAMMSNLRLSNEFSRSDAEIPLDLHLGETRGYWKQLRPDEWFNPSDGESTAEATTSERPHVSEIRRSGTALPDLLPGESRGYWKHHSPGKWFLQAKITGKINNEKAILLLDTGAEVSIVDTTFARKVGCHIDTSQSQECVGIGENVYSTEGRTRIKITLAGSLVYFFDIWVGDLSGQEAILGMDFMVPAGIRLDLADGSICLPDEVKIQLSGRRQLYNDKARLLLLDQHSQIDVGESVELPLRLRTSNQKKLWGTRGDRWVPSVVNGPGRVRYVQITNISDKKLILQRDDRIGIWLAGDRVPRLPGFVSIGSRRYAEWQNLAFQATSEHQSDQPEAYGSRSEPAVDRPTYPTPRAILQRSRVTPIVHDGADLPADPPVSEHESEIVASSQVNSTPAARRSPDCTCKR